MNARHKCHGPAEELIQRLSLRAEFAAQLAPYVRDKYAELWRHAQTAEPDDADEGPDFWSADRG